MEGNNQSKNDVEEVYSSQIDDIVGTYVERISKIKAIASHPFFPPFILSKLDPSIIFETAEEVLIEAARPTTTTNTTEKLIEKVTKIEKEIKKAHSSKKIKDLIILLEKGSKDAWEEDMVTLKNIQKEPDDIEACKGAKKNLEETTKDYFEITKKLLSIIKKRNDIKTIFKKHKQEKTISLEEIEKIEELKLWMAIPQEIVTNYSLLVAYSLACFINAYFPQNNRAYNATIKTLNEIDDYLDEVEEEKEMEMKKSKTIELAKKQEQWCKAIMGHAQTLSKQGEKKPLDIFHLDNELDLNCIKPQWKEIAKTAKEYNSLMDKAINEVRKTGIKIEKITVDAVEYYKWLAKTKNKNTSQSRIEYLNHKRNTTQKMK